MSLSSFIMWITLWCDDDDDDNGETIGGYKRKKLFFFFCYIWFKAKKGKLYDFIAWFDIFQSNFCAEFNGKIARARRKRKTFFLRQHQHHRCRRRRESSSHSPRWNSDFLIVLMFLCPIFHFNFVHNLMILNKFIQFKTKSIPFRLLRKVLFFSPSHFLVHSTCKNKYILCAC